jgi:cation transport ATPase
MTHHDHHHGESGHHHRLSSAAPGVKDPVCGMTVDPATSEHHAVHGRQTYHFCTEGCETKFKAAPERYLSEVEDPATEPAPAGAIYTCPMHPQIRRPAPGNCPICGMALEPEIATGETGPSAELRDMTRRFWIGLGLAVPVFLLEMGGHLLDLHMWLGPQTSNWIRLAQATPVVLWAGWPFFERGWQSIVNRSLNMFTLIAMGIGVAWIYSVVGTVAPGIFPATFRSVEGSVAVYFEAAAVITVLVLLGQVLELRAREQTGGAIRALLDLVPKTARRVRDDGGDEDIGLDVVVVGDRLRVRSDETVPVDGELIEGRSSIDEAMVTGESMPVTKDVGSALIGGTLNRSGGFIMRAGKIGSDTMLSRIVAMVAQAQRSRADPTPRRPGLRLVRAASDRRRGARLRGLDAVGARAAVRPWPLRRRSRADHRLPLRAGARHADVDHGGRRPRREPRRADQERRGAGAL